MTHQQQRARRVVFWGTYDLGKPRVRLLLEGARRAGLEVLECHSELWAGIEDKSEIRGRWRRLRFPLRWFLRLPGLVWRYLRLPAHDVVVIPYLGQFDVLVLKPWAWIRHKPIYLDAFISLYDTVVLDRQRVAEGSLAARGLWLLEWLAYRAADEVFLDTAPHARAVEEMFRLPRNSVGTVWVGAEEMFHQPEVKAEGDGSVADGPEEKSGGPEALFYGQFIPLHGVDTIVEAAAILEREGEKIRWRMVGSGQEAPRIDRRIRDLGLQSIQREDWISYDQLPAAIRRADVCLGVFGRSGKASRVIPNKVFQIVAAGRPLVTADTPGVRELLTPGPAVSLVPAGDAEALARAVLDLGRRARESPREVGADSASPRVDAGAVGSQLAEYLFPEVEDETR